MHVNAWWHQLFIFTTHFIGQTYSNKRRSVAYLSKKGIIARRNHIVRINMAIHSNKWASRWQICCYSPCCPNKDWEHLERLITIIYYLEDIEIWRVVIYCVVYLEKGKCRILKGVNLPILLLQMIGWKLQVVCLNCKRLLIF